MFVSLGEAVDQVRSVLRGLDPDVLSGAQAVRALELFAELERLAAAGRTLAAGRVDRSGAWRASGAKDPAQFVADATRSTLGAGMATIELAARLEGLDRTEAALRDGLLSPVQAVEVVRGAVVDPLAETRLLRTAVNGTVREVRDEARRVVAAAVDERERYERVRRSRALRTWSDADGVFRMDARLTPDAGATVMAALAPLRDEIFKAASRTGARESGAAYAADALVELAHRSMSLTVSGDATSADVRELVLDGGAPLSRDARAGRRRPGEERPTTMRHTVVNVHVDHAALVRGSVGRGERCEINDAGPVPVGVVQRLLTDAHVNVIVRGTQKPVHDVVSAGRTIPNRVRVALEVRDPVCAIDGCDRRFGLEIDHVIPFAQGGPTRLSNLVRLCAHHHDLKTYDQWRLEPHGDGRWTMAPPPRGPAARGPAGDGELVAPEGGGRAGERARDGGEQGVMFGTGPPRAA